MPVTDYLARKLIAHSVGQAAYPVPSATYVALYTSSPTDVGGGSLVEDAIFQQIRWSAPVYDDDNEIIIANSNAIIWSSAPSNWGTITSWGILDSASGSPNVLWFGDFDFPYSDVGIGDQFTIAVGDIVLSID